MKTTITYLDKNEKLRLFADAIQKQMEASGFEVVHYKITESDTNIQEIARSHSSDLIIIGAETTSWDGFLPESLSSFVKECSYIEGRKIAVFITKSFLGSKKALHNLMKLVEERGGFLFDFEIIGSEKQAREYGKRLTSVEAWKNTQDLKQISS